MGQSGYVRLASQAISGQSVNHLMSDDVKWASLFLSDCSDW